MRAPAFWQGPPNTFAALCLSPVAAIWGQIAARRMARLGVRVDVPVVCVGNFTAGGAGKTPTAIALSDLLKRLGKTPVFLSRGYGGSLGGVPVCVDLKLHSALQVGDEPLLLARHAPTIVARDRVAGARAAIAAGANVILMDDGLQNPSLCKDLSLVVVDAATGFGNGRCLPAGPLRAPLTAQWPHVAGMILIGTGVPGERAATQALAQDVPVFEAFLEPDAIVAGSLKGKKVFAFAGIGRPEKFYRTLRDLGADVVATRNFADHAALSRDHLQILAREARSARAILVTTQKDAVRAAALWDALDVEKAVLPVALRFEDPSGLTALLQTTLRRRDL